MRRSEDARELASGAVALREGTAELAHEFANLWTAALGTLDLARTRPGLSAELRNDLTTLRALVRTGRRLTRHLRRLSSQGAPPHRTFALDRLLTREAPRIRQGLPPNVEVTARVGPGDFRIWGVRDQVRLVLWTLAFNARDAMPQGGHLHFELQESPRPLDCGEVEFGSACVLEVTDNGRGMEPEVLSRAFEARFSTKPVERAGGLGLHHVRRIVERHRGQVELQSVVEQGTTLRIRFPRWEEPAPTRPDRLPLESEAEPLARRTVLVAEDDPDTREVLIEMIRALGFSVVSAACGAEALERHVEHWREVSLVVTDLRMPGMGGDDLIRTLAARDSRLRFVIISGDSARGGIDASLRRSVSAWLTKPVDLARLRGVLQKALRESQTAPNPAR